MESSLTAPFRGRVKQVFVGENVHVGPHSPLLALEAIEQAANRRRRRSACRSSSLTASGDGAPDPCRENLRRIEWLVLGYDIGAAEVERTIADLHGQCADLLACDPALIPGEHRLLGMFADLRAVSRPDRVDPEPESELPRARRSTCTRGCARSTPRPRRCRAGSPPPFAGRSAITGSTASSGPRPWRRRATGCFSPSSGRDRAHRDHRDSRPAARGCRRARRARGRGVSRGSRPARDRARGARPGRRRSGPRDPLPLLRRAA